MEDETLSSPLQKLKIEPKYNVYSIIRQDFQRLQGHCYLDHAGATLYSDNQIKEACNELQLMLLGNPHSRHASSDAVTQIIDAVRQRILDHFNVTPDDYDVIFTSGATEALKIVGECFEWSCAPASECRDTKIHTSQHDMRDTVDTGTPFESSSTWKEIDSNSKHDEAAQPGAFVYTRENHTSVTGIREYADQNNADVYCVSFQDVENIMHSISNNDTACQSINHYHNDILNSPNDVCKRESKYMHCLFAYSAQCNFSGRKGPLDWISKIHEGALDGILRKRCAMNRSSQQSSDTLNKAGLYRKFKWFTLLDAAGLSATSPLDLSKWRPDFVPVSFYKIFGYPTGLGCLLVHHRAWGTLKKRYYGGGTVLMMETRKMLLVPRPRLHDRFEDGTLPYLNILALRHGFDTIQKHTGGMDNVKHHVFHLARYTHHCLRSYQHANGNPVAKLYSQDKDWYVDVQGSIVNFNLLDSTGHYIGYSQVERVATLYNIHLRTGCVCNPGACQTYLDISEEKVMQQFEAGHVCGDSQDLVDGAPTGSVRISFGYMSTYEDADLLLKMVCDCFVEGPLRIDLSWMSMKDIFPHDVKKGEVQVVSDLELEGIAKSQDLKSETGQLLKSNSNGTKGLTGNNENVLVDKNLNPKESTTAESTYEIECTESTSGYSMSQELQYVKPRALHLTDIILYPVKSCGGVSVSKWSLYHTGLKHDHQWMVVTSSGITLTQKRIPRMNLITPDIDLENGLLTLSYEGEGSVSIPLECPATDSTDLILCSGRVCGDRVKGTDCGPEVGAWLSKVLGQANLHLMQQTMKRKGKLDYNVNEQENLSLANESQYLVIHRPSVRKLLDEIHSKGSIQLTEDELVRRFRGNLILDGGVPYEEDAWTSITISSLEFQIQGGCRRCQMVCVVPDTGERTREPMLTLAETRGSSMKFGVHATAAAMHMNSPKESVLEKIIRVGDVVVSRTDN